MKILYFDCGMGAAGDMLCAALLELLPDSDAFLQKLNDLSIPGVRFVRESSVKCGISGTHLKVQVHHTSEDALFGDTAHMMHRHESAEHGHAAHGHRSLHDIEHIVSHFSVSAKIREDILCVYRRIAEAESHAHAVPVSQIHFHEVGTMDAIADVTAFCMLMDALAPDRVIASPIHVGWGEVHCAHGILPVPAPATAYLLRGVPVYGGKIKGELCTPTGAALITHFADCFEEMPFMTIQAIGYGMGRKDFERANCVRAILGESEGSAILELSCNVDDMTGEEIGFAMEQFFAEGALDVYTIPIGMKKSRPGTLLRILCQESDREKMIQTIFTHTTTLGIREAITKRHTLQRSLETVSTAYGPVRRKISEGYGIRRSKYEYEDLAQIARTQNKSIEEVRRELP